MLADSSTSFRNPYEYNNNGSSVNGSQSLEVLFEFLKEAELQHYFDDLTSKLKVRSVAHFKYVDGTDLVNIGMSRPEMRRLKKFFEKEYPQTAMGKIKKKLARSSSNRSTSVPRPQELSSRMSSFTGRTNFNGQSASPISSDDLTTICSVTNFSIASNGTSDSYDFRQSGNKHLILQNQLTLGTLLRRGDFVEIHQGSFRSGQSQIQVAVKVITKSYFRNDCNEFVKEIFANCYLEHSNVVRLYGISLDDLSIKLITELSELGSLTECLLSTNSKLVYPVTELHNFSTQICGAMKYLEERRVVHGHLTCQNVLMFSDSQIKISDVGMFRGCSAQDSSFNYRVSTAPEVHMGQQPSLLSDVWSFGVTLFEIYSYCKSPLNRSSTDLTRSLDNSLISQLPQPDLCPNLVFNVILSCWTEQPASRPSFYQLLNQLVRLQPEELTALCDGPDDIPSNRTDDLNEPSDGSYSSLGEVPMLCYNKDDTVIVLDRSMSQYKDFWRGCLLNGESGFFKWENMCAPTVSVTSNTVEKQKSKTISNCYSPLPSKSGSNRTKSVGEAFAKLRLSRRESDRKAKPGRLSVDMISAPIGDFRHVGHVGCNGEVFGDVTSLYTTTAQQNIKSGVLSINSKIDSSTNLSEAGSIRSTSTLNAAGDDTPPYATIDNEPTKSQLNSLEKGSTSLFNDNIVLSPPLPPVRSCSEEDKCISKSLEDVVGTQYKSCNNEFSLFDELCQVWESQSYKLDSSDSVSVTKESSSVSGKYSNSETSNSAVDNRYSQSEYTPTPKTSRDSLTNSFSNSNVSLYVTPTSSDAHVSKIPSIRSSSFASQPIATTAVTAKPVTTPTKSTGFLNKFKSLGANKTPKNRDVSTEEKCKKSESPVYAKIIKQPKTKKQTDQPGAKKNVISSPILISAPMIASDTINNEDCFLDCSSEVSSLQPSPRDSLLCLTNATYNPSLPPTDNSMYYNRQNSNITYDSRGKNSDSATTVSPASSFASLTSVPSTNVLQGGAALRAIRKGDGVFRAPSAVNAMGRRRSSASGQTEQTSMEGTTLPRNRLPLFPIGSTGVRFQSSTLDRKLLQPKDNQSGEQLEPVLDSAATTPIAVELPDLPFLSKDVSQQKSKLCDEDDPYNSLHSGSNGSDTIEPRCSTRQSQFDNFDRLYSPEYGGDSMSNQSMDKSSNSINNFKANSVKRFNIKDDDDEVAL